jgi:hypothetical protein
MSELKQNGQVRRPKQKSRSIIPFRNPKRAVHKNSADVSRAKSKKLPMPKLRISLTTLLEVEQWAEKARVGTTRYSFDPILRQIKYNGDVLDDVIHSLTLAQIMPYQEIKRYLAIHGANPVSNDFDFVCDLAIKYHTSRENVVERIHHVRSLKHFWDEHKT